MTRHFEKKGVRNLFRRIAVAGSTLRLAVGLASEGTHELAVKCRSKAAAAALAATWSRWALDAGFAEVAPFEGTPGVLFHLAASSGPGRVRDDAGRNVYFAPAAIEGVALEQGQRVLLERVKKNPRLSVAFMFGSKLEAKGVRPFPTPRWAAFEPRPDPSEKERRRLVALAGPGLLARGEPGAKLDGLACGSLCFAYEKGVHRVLCRTRGPDDELVLTEPVLTSKLTRQSGPPQEQVAKFIAPLSDRFRRELERLYGLGPRVRGIISLEGGAP